MSAEAAIRNTVDVPRRPPRSPDPDAWAAWRVAYERERHGWTQTELARLVTEAGAPIRQQTVWEIENRQPPRRISLGEAIAFCQVFEFQDVAELGKPPEETTGKAQHELIAAFREWELSVNDVLARTRHFCAEIARLDSGPGSWPEETLDDLASTMATMVEEFSALKSTIDAARETGPED